MARGIKGIAKEILPSTTRFGIIDGEEFVRLRDAAKLAGIHPTCLSMGKELLTQIGGRGVSLALATPELQRAAPDLIKAFKTGLRKVAKAYEPNKKLKLKAFREGNRLVFWYTT